MNYAHYSDEVLIQLIFHKDPNALGALFDRHAQTAHNLIMHIVKDPAVADEILQETYWQIWHRTQDWQYLGAARAQVYQVARAKSLDYVRKHQKTTQYTPRQPGEPDGVTTSRTTVDGVRHRSVEQEISQQLERQQLLRAIASIPQDQMACLELAYFDGLTQSQIATHLNIPLGTVKTRVRVGVEKLEHILRTTGQQRKSVDNDIDL